MGELIVDVIRKEKDISLDRPGLFEGPFPSGAPANFINACARIGGDAGFIGIVGDDDFGKMDLERLRESGVDISQVKVRKGYTTGTAFISYKSDGTRDFVFHLTYSAAGTLYEDDVDEDYLKEAKLIHINGSALALSESSKLACFKAVEIVYRNGGLVSFDPNIRKEILMERRMEDICGPILEKTKMIFPSGEEASMLTEIDNEDEACRELLKYADIIGLKSGEAGSKIFAKDEEIIVPSIKVKEIDPTGAGDGFDAGFVVAYLEGKPLKECARSANIVGALSVTKMGPMEGNPLRQEVEKILKETD